MTCTTDTPLFSAVQRRLRASGVVQGVGFRPHVWRLAHALGLTGWVRNDAGGVEILVEGEAGAVDAFTRRLSLELPPLARLRDLSWYDATPSGRHTDFVILASASGPAATMIGHDTAVCADCLAELFDPRDRRWRYAFINCTQCGPRYTLTRGLPYDRARTSMAAFPLCPACAREYADPADRRFHAEPTACPVCGPRLWLEDPAAAGNPAADPIAGTLALLQAGAIVAIKGLGGFHLACDARNADAVQRLRLRKGRDEKPFAVMAANVTSFERWAEVGGAARALLESPERPIVLLRKRPDADQALPGIAPGLAWLGVMLPYTPLHWLLFHEAAGRPAGTDWMRKPLDLLLVMTSANPGGEPLVIDNAEARTRLAGIADAWLMHDRDIVVRCDDSVVRLAPEPPCPSPHERKEEGGRGEAEGGRRKDEKNRFSSFLLPPSSFSVSIRRARGYTPRPIRLAVTGPSVLALGGHLKNTVCLTRGDEAYVSQHIGGLDNPATCVMLTEVTQHLLDLLEVRPAAVAHDLNPDFFSTRHALSLAAHWDVPAIAVQHHHAHIAAVMAEHGVEGPVLGLALDGVGLGPDGTAWGGELLRVDGAGYRRLGHLRPLPLPGGDRAAREPWRMAAAALYALGRGEEIARRFPDQPQAVHMHTLLQSGLNCPPTTSLGRWFDAAAGLLGVCTVMRYEGQAAMLLEGLAEQALDRSPLCAGYVIEADGQLDLLPLLRRLADETDARRGAALFHATLAEGLAEWVMRAADREGLDTVACGGGCFLNHLLLRRLTALLGERGLRVLTAAEIPPNDGGLSLGQAWVAMRLQAKGL